MYTHKFHLDEANQCERAPTHLHMKWETRRCFLSSHPPCSTDRSTCPECSTPNPQPAPRRGQTLTSPTAPRRPAQPTAPWIRTADSGRFLSESMSSWEVACPNCWWHQSRPRPSSPERISSCGKEQKCAKVQIQGLIQPSCKKMRRMRNLLLLLLHRLFISCCLFLSLTMYIQYMLHFCLWSFKHTIMHLWESKSVISYIKILVNQSFSSHLHLILFNEEWNW